jgi:hypothetical protein
MFSATGVNTFLTGDATLGDGVGSFLAAGVFTLIGVATLLAADFLGDSVFFPLGSNFRSAVCSCCSGVAPILAGVLAAGVAFFLVKVSGLLNSKVTAALDACK